VGASASVSVGEQASDTTTDVWGMRGERSRFERSGMVTVRVRVDYDLTFRHTTVGANSAANVLGAPTYAATTGEAYLTMHLHDYEAMRASAGSGHVVHAPEVQGTSFVADGRSVAEKSLEASEAAAAASRTRQVDFGGLLSADPRQLTVGEEPAVVVEVRGRPQHFKVRVGEVPPTKMAATEVHTGLESDPHVVTFAPGIANDQLARLWVHEISHTVQEVAAPDGGPVRRLAARLTGGGHNACVEAQYNEFRYLVRQWLDAVTAADAEQAETIRRDAEGLAHAIEARGHAAPPYPWLTPEEIQQVYVDRFEQLVPPSPPDRAPGERPCLFLVGGQPAAGKSTAQRRLHAALGRDDVALYDGDDNYTVHPRYEAIIRQWGRQAHALVMAAMPKDLHQRCLDLLRAGDPQYDVVASHPLAKWEFTKRWPDGFRPHGYRISVVYLATNNSNSLLGAVDRYQNDLDNRGGGRWYDPQLHDDMDAVLPDTAHRLESEGLVDDIYVVTRDGYVLYENHLDGDGNWEREPASREAIVAGRDRPPTPEEREYFERTANRLLNGRDPALPPLEDEVRRTLEGAERREHARPQPEPGNAVVAVHTGAALLAALRRAQEAARRMAERANQVSPPEGRPE
jgi:hypothetical protein